MVLFLITLTSLLFAQPKDYFQQDVTYKIDITLHPETKTYEGHEIFTYKNNSNQTLDYLWFHFYPNAYKNESTPYGKEQERSRSTLFHFSKKDRRGFLNLNSAKIDGKELKWEYKSDAIDEIKIHLPEPLKPGLSLTMKMEFEGKFPRLNSRMKFTTDNYFSATQWYPKIVVFDRDGWHPDSYLNNGEFYGEFGDFDVSITLPENYVIDATGMLQENLDEEKFIKTIVESTSKLVQLESKKERKKFVKEWIKDRKEKTDFDKTKTVRFIAKNVHDFAWFAGEKYMMYQSKDKDDVLINVLVDPENAYDWKEVTRFVDHTLWFYGKHVGKYEYPKASVVNGGRHGSGGMEYPMITTITIPAMEWAKLLELVVMHEVGHNWFYGMLGTDERKETFMDEGVNSFLEYKYMEHFHGFNNITDFKALTKIDLLEDIGEWHLLNMTYGSLVSTQTDQPMNLRAEEYSGINYGSITYHKGALMLLALEWLIGKENFWKGMHLYFDTWTGKHPTSKDFFDIMSQVSGMDLNSFYKEWITKTTYNDFVLKKKKTYKRNDGFETEVFIKNKGTMKGMAAPISLITENGDTLSGRWNGDPEKPVIIKHNSPAKKIEVNLERSIFETNYLNNKKGLPKFDIDILAEFPRYDTYPIEFYPYYWYDEFVDKHRVGLGFWAGNPFIKQYCTSGSFYYGTNSEKIGYSFDLTNRYTNFLLNYSDLHAGIRDKSGLKNISLGLKTVYQKPSDSRFKATVQLGLDNVNLYNADYSESKIFEPYKYSTISAEGEIVFKRMLYRLTTKVNFEKAIDAFESEGDYFKLTFTTNYYRRLTKNLAAKVRFFGSGIWGDNLPIQERIYLGGGIDPKHKRFAFERRGGMAPLRTWTYEDGMNMPGYARLNGYYPSGKSGASINMELNYYRFSLPALYVTVGTISKDVSGFGSDDIITEAGVKFRNGPLTLIIPLYVSDPTSGEKHFDFRFIMNINIGKSISIGF